MGDRGNSLNRNDAVKKPLTRGRTRGLGLSLRGGGKTSCVHQTVSLTADAETVLFRFLSP
jgi:hypothetical protein